MRVTDLIPVRPFAAVFLILLGLTGVAAIETTYIYLATLPLGSAGQYLSALDVNQRGSVATYYSALLLALGAAGELLVTQDLEVVETGADHGEPESEHADQEEQSVPHRHSSRKTTCPTVGSARPSSRVARWERRAGCAR